MMMEKEYKLPKAFALEWISALRSGKYKQANGVLCSIDQSSREESYCCLGVAGNICGIQPKQFGNAQWLARISDVNGKYSFGDSQIQQHFWSRIPKELIGGPSKNKLVRLLSKMNDEDSSFDLIADWIEQNVEFYD